MKRTVNVKALLILGGIILSLGLIYLIGYLLPPEWQTLNGTPSLGVFWDNIINGLMAVLMFGIAVCVMAIIAVGICLLVGWVFPKKKVNGE